MNKISPFQIIIMAFMGIAAVVAVMVFGGFLPGYKDKGGGSAKAEKVSLWGTFPRQKISSVISVLNREKQNVFNIGYTEVPDGSYEEEVVNALASDKGPDMWIISQDMVLKNKDRIFPMPFSQTYTRRNFFDNFIDAGGLFLDGDSGAIGMPFLIDPIILYWNKDLFASAGISRAPRYWDEFIENAKTLTIKNEAGNITQSGAAMGEFSNVVNAKEILSALIMQSGNPISEADERGNFRIIIDKKNSSGARPAESAINFFNQFSNPNKDAYAWNKALLKSDAMFAKGSLAMYFGYASDMESIRNKNPHLNFDIAEMPQIKNSGSKITFGKIYAIAALKNSIKTQSKLTAVLSAIFNLTSKQSTQSFSEVLGLSPARRDALSESSSDAYFSLLNKVSLVSRAWLEPDSGEVNVIFKNMAESVATGKASASDAVNVAKRRLEQLLPR